MEVVVFLEFLALSGGIQSRTRSLIPGNDVVRASCSTNGAVRLDVEENTRVEVRLLRVQLARSATMVPMRMHCLVQISETRVWRAVVFTCRTLLNLSAIPVRLR